MPAHEHLSPELFHGSGHFFQEGERITPSNQHYGQGSLSGVPLSFATSDFERAQDRAGFHAKNKGMLFAPVFSVTAEDEVPTKEHELVHSTDAVSKKGHVIKKQVGWGINKDLKEDSFFVKNYHTPFIQGLLR